MIEIFSTRTEVGYYENTEKILNMANGIVGAIGSVMLPRISYLMGKNDSVSVKNYMSKSMRYIMIFSIAISFGVAGISKEFSLIFFGNDFEACGNMVLIMSLAVLFYSWENILRTQYLLPGNRDRVFVMGTILAAITNIIINVALIPVLGALGAVTGTVGAQFVAAFYQSISVRRELPLLKYIKSLIPSLCNAIVMFIYCKITGALLGVHVFTVLIQVVGGILIFCLLEIIHLLIIKDPLALEILKKVGIKK